MNHGAIVDDILSKLTKRQLDFFTFGKRDIYTERKIMKSNGRYRTLREPTYVLKLLQKKILHELLAKKDEVLVGNVTGFRKGRSIVDNANYHIGCKYVLKIDIKDFFPSISSDRLYGLFTNLFELDHRQASYLSGLCTYNNELPQGSPTSPMLANLIARCIDYRVLGMIVSYTNKNKSLIINYSRYADDLTFSFNKNINFNQFIEYIINIIEDEGFFPNYRKIHLFSQGKQQNVTGIVVNKKTSLGRKKYKKFKSIFINIKYKGFSSEMIRWNTYNNTSINNEEKFKEILKGHLNFMRQVSPEYYENIIKVGVIL